MVTPSGGQHFYFRHPTGHIANSVGKLGPGLDVRATGGYVLLPPSVGVNGRRYEPDERCALAPVPDWLLDRLKDGAANGSRKPVPASSTQQRERIAGTCRAGGSSPR